jgi:cellulose synthase operon protein C
VSLDHPLNRSLAPAFLVTVATLCAIPTNARGDVSERLPRLAKLHADIEGARGPLAYVALRTLWSEWDRGDPTGVEEVLHEVGADAQEPAPVRAYAELLEAYARRRRGDLDGARSRIAQLGFVGRWMLVGPFDNDGKAGFVRPYDPEKEQQQPIDLTHDYDGKDHKPVRWRMLPAASPYGWVDFGAFVRPAEQACVYATTFVRDARVTGRATRVVSLWAGATGALQLFWNGSAVLSDDKYRDLDSDRFAAAALLREGYNRLTAKVCGDERAPMLSLRVAAADGAPDDRLEVDADPRHSGTSGGAAMPLGRATEPDPRTHLEGPAQAFERLSQGGDPAVLEAYARYLGTTGSDDPTEHRARELARRAAEQTPTIERVLLAGELTEGRNQRVSWIDRAEAMVAGGRATRQQQIDVLLARAALARAGVNWRDAVPFYERVLALDPDNVLATLAKVEAYEEAGLRDTALSVLERALTRRPRSVALLRAAAASLHDEGRETEADELAERYSQVRFDDPAFARARIELAVARRDAASAARWIDRLVATDPDSSGALRSAAQAWMRLGDRPRAIAVYRAALDLAPEDTDLLRELATAHALSGERDEQLRLLKRVVELMPQAKDVREEVAHIEPAKPRPDEQYARPASEFLAARARPSAGEARRRLVDVQVSTVFLNGLASRFRQVVYEPLTDAAAAESREYNDIVFETDTQTVQIRTARVYRKDGSIDDAVETGAGAMNDDPARAMYTTDRRYYVRFPRLEPGDVVELQYRVEDVAPRNAFADYFGEVAYLQSSYLRGTEAVGRSEYVLITPKARTFYFNEPHIPGLERTVEDRGDQRIYRFVGHDLPALQEEAQQPPWEEVLGHVHVSTYKSWEEMGRWYWGLVKDQFVPDDEVRRRAEALTAGLKDEASRVRAVYDYVVQKTRYVALEFGIHGYKPYRCAQIFARGFGDCKDKATLIVTMLGALGIKATPVIVRTANRGAIETSPASLAPFDHMIAYVPSLDLYLDGTAEYTGALELPAMDRGAVALQVNEGAARLVTLPDPPAGASVSADRLEASLSADGSAQLDWRVDVRGVEASQWRVLFHAGATRMRRTQDVVASMLPGSEVTAVDAGNLEDVEQNVTMHVRGKAPHFSRGEGDVSTVPLGRREHMVRDYAPMSTRKFDLRLLAQWTQIDDWVVRLPPGAKLKSGPTPAGGSSPFGSYAVEVDTSTNAVHVKTTVTLAKTRIGASEYGAFRAWCAEVDRALGQRAAMVFR